jgi:hypothetical protein
MTASFEKKNNRPTDKNNELFIAPNPLDRTNTHTVNYAIKLIIYLAFCVRTRRRVAAGAQHNTTNSGKVLQRFYYPRGTTGRGTRALNTSLVMFTIFENSKSEYFIT